MKKILIVWALSREINVIKEEIVKLELRNIKTSFLTTGMWNYNIILNLTRFLENHDFDLVINIWVCGFKEWKKDFISVWRILNLTNHKELIIPNIIDFSNSESIACSEKPVYDEELLLDENYIDMESYGFEIVCDSFSIPRIILKIPVDKIWVETKNFDFEKAEKYLRNNINYKELFEKINNYLENHFNIWKGKYKLNHDIFETYNERFNFTFSENEIFKRLYYRYIALVNKDFDSYYEEHKEESKKEFLKWLEVFLEDFLVR
jgi:hypothetical protein